MQYPAHFKEYESARYRLRALHEGDVQALYENFSDARLMKYYDMEPLKSLEEAEDLLAKWQFAAQRGTAFRWAIAEKDSNELVGTVGMHDLNPMFRRGEIGCEVNPHYWGRGVMRDVVPSILHHAFVEMELNRLSALVSPENRPCIKLLETNGFKREGLLRGYIHIHDASVDLLSFGLLAQDYFGRTAAPEEAVFVV